MQDWFCGCRGKFARLCAYSPVHWEGRGGGERDMRERGGRQVGRQTDRQRDA